MTKAIKPSNSGVAGRGAPVSWTPKSRLLTTKLSTAFLKDQGRGERRGGKAAEGKGKEEEEAGDLQSGLGALSITSPALGGERKALDTCGSGRTEFILRGRVKGTEQWWHRAAIQTGSWHLSLLSWHLRKSQSANGSIGRKEGSHHCKPFHPLLTYPFIHSFHE